MNKKTLVIQTIFFALLLYFLFFLFLYPGFIVFTEKNIEAGIVINPVLRIWYNEVEFLRYSGRQFYNAIYIIVLAIALIYVYVNRENEKAVIFIQAGNIILFVIMASIFFGSIYFVNLFS